MQTERPSTVMSTAEAVSVGLQAGLDAFYYGERRLTPEFIGRHLAGSAIKDNADALTKLKHYFDVVAPERSKTQGSVWESFLKARKVLANVSSGLLKNQNSSAGSNCLTKPRHRSVNSPKGRAASFAATLSNGRLTATAARAI